MVMMISDVNNDYHNSNNGFMMCLAESSVHSRTFAHVSISRHDSQHILYTLVHNNAHIGMTCNIIWPIAVLPFQFCLYEHHISTYN